MSSFYQDLPGPVRDRRASLPAQGREDAFLRGGGASDDQFLKEVADEPDDRGLLGAWERLDRKYKLEQLDPSLIGDRMRKTPWLKPGDKETLAWEAKSKNTALDSQERFQREPTAFGINHPLVPKSFDAKARRSLATPAGVGFDPTDEMDIRRANDLASRQESLADNWRGRYAGEGKVGIWDMEADERRVGSSVGGFRELFGEHLAYRRKSSAASGRVSSQESTINSEADEQVRGMPGNSEASEQVEEMPGTGVNHAVRPKKSLFSRLFNMKSGYANPLAWLYQAGKGIGKGLSSLFGGGGQQKPETSGEDDGNDPFAEEQDVMLEALFFPKRVTGP